MKRVRILRQKKRKGLRNRQKNKIKLVISKEISLNVKLNSKRKRSKMRLSYVDHLLINSPKRYMQ